MSEEKPPLHTLPTDPCDFCPPTRYNKEYLEYSCDDGIWTHARVVIYNNRLYLKYYQQSDFTRSQAALALLHMAVVTSREKLPNVEFCIGMMDWGSRGKFGLDRAPDLEDVWMMPDYGWFSWPEVSPQTQFPPLGSVTCLIGLCSTSARTKSCERTRHGWRRRSGGRARSASSSGAAR